MLTGSSLPLGDVAAVDSGAATVSSRVSDAGVLPPRTGWAPSTAASTPPGTGRGPMRSPSAPGTWDLKGSAQIHVVDALTSLTVSKAGGTSPHLSLAEGWGERPAGPPPGSYWSREALRPGSGGGPGA